LKPGKLRSTRKADALVALRGIDGGEDDEEVGLRRVGDPELAPGQLPVVTAVHRPAGQRESVGAGTRLRQGVGAHPLRSQLREVARVLLGVAPAQQRVVDERVLHVHEHGQGRVHPGQGLHGEDGHEERRARAPVGFRDLDAHHPELEAGVDEVARDGRLLVHLVHERPHALFREVAYRLLEQALVFAEVGQGQAAADGERLGHRSTSVALMLREWGYGNRTPLLTRRHAHV
jgi:hypothetical protein